MTIHNFFKPHLILAVFGTFFIFAPPAFAVERLLSIGSNASYTTSEGTTVETGDTFLVDLSADRSYSCEGFASDINSNFDWSTTVVGTAASPETVTAKATGNTVPVIAGETGDSADNRITFTPTKNDRFRLTVASAKVGGEFVKIRCLATTLFGGFNTFVNDFNFLELTNIGNKTIAGKVTAFNFNGVKEIEMSFSVFAKRRVDIDLHTPIGENKYGTVIVTYDAPLGTLIGNVSQYEAPGNSGNVNNFSLTTTIPLVPFAQHP